MEDVLGELNTRLNVYMSVLKSAEDEGNASKVRRYKRIIKQYTDAIKNYSNGKPILFDELPNPPGFSSMCKDEQLTLTPNPSPRPGRRSPITPSNQDASPNVSPVPLHRLGENSTLKSTNVNNRLQFPDESLGSNYLKSDTDDVTENISIPIIVTEGTDDVNYTDILTDPVALLSALNSRLETYNLVKETAEQEGNGSKVRRYQRILKQYKDAINLLQSGETVPLDELPNPPGFPPLVPPKSAPPSPLPERSNIDYESVEPSIKESDDSVNRLPTTSTGKLVTSRAEKQTLQLREKQQEYRDAALAAKKLGQIEEAKEYLKIYKGFERLIKASECGLPVDMTTIPVSPKAKQTMDDDFHFVTDADLIEVGGTDLFQKLETELTEQIKSCINIRNNFKSNGDIANANRFEQFALSFKKDLNSVKASHQRGDILPKFHYENKSFGIIQCFNDLKVNELELTIVQGVDYKVSNPDDVDTYVKYEFPYPTENPPKGKTDVVRNTNNPQYNTKIIFNIHREVKACQRIFKRHGVKLEVMSKGGFFHSDTVLGTIVVKLMSLNTEILIHDAFDLMNGRRPAGGKLEVKIRVREPLLSKKLEQVSEKWLILD